MYCESCDCTVAYANWDAHLNGRRHCENDRSYDDDSNCSYDSDYDCQCDAPSTFPLPVGHIYYNQDSIAPEFRNGTTLTQGISNLKQLVPIEWNRQDRDWGGVYLPYVIDVFEIDGCFVAFNSRTLYCYKAAGFAYAPVNIVDPPRTQRRRYGDVYVRGGSNPAEEAQQ